VIKDECELVTVLCFPALLLLRSRDLDQQQQRRHSIIALLPLPLSLLAHPLISRIVSLRHISLTWEKMATDDTVSLVNDSIQLFEEKTDAATIEQIRQLNGIYQIEARRIQETIQQTIQELCQQAELTEQSNSSRPESAALHQQRVQEVEARQQQAAEQIQVLESEKAYDHQALSMWQYSINRTFSGLTRGGILGGGSVLEDTAALTLAQQQELERKAAESEDKRALEQPRIVYVIVAGNLTALVPMASTDMTVALRQ